MPGAPGISKQDLPRYLLSSLLQISGQQVSRRLQGSQPDFSFNRLRMRSEVLVIATSCIVCWNETQKNNLSQKTDPQTAQVMEVVGIMYSTSGHRVQASRGLITSVNPLEKKGDGFIEESDKR